ncbi:MAG TPA: hypothetical protein VMJ10_30220 [Kofleriaceae bacterium]|nr:hypothetical protein [Kofleriaceae bacterium]
MKKTHQQLARTSNHNARNQNTSSGVSPEHEALVKQFVAERDRALLSLDEATIRAHNRKWSVRTPDDPNIFWIGIHKARTACLSLPREERILSKMWLTARGYYSLDDGDLDFKVGAA